MQPITSQSLNQIRLALDEALAAAEVAGDPGVSSAILMASSEVARSTIEATNREMTLQAQALAAGMTVIPNYSTQLESRDTLKQRLKGAENKLKESQTARGELSDQLSEHKNQLFIAGGSFWFRRFHSSLAIASAAAFLAISTHLFDPETAKNTVRASVYPMGFFGTALITSGCVPAAFALKKERAGWALSIAAAALFSVAIFFAVAGAISIGGLPWPAAPRP